MDENMNITEVTPEPTPEPTSEPTPEPTPEPTLEPTPEPTNDPTEQTGQTETESNIESDSDMSVEEVVENNPPDSSSSGVVCSCEPFVLDYDFFSQFKEHEYEVHIVNEEQSIMEKPLADYTPTEGLLVLIFILLLINIIMQYSRKEV